MTNVQLMRIFMEHKLHEKERANGRRKGRRITLNQFLHSSPRLLTGLGVKSIELRWNFFSRDESKSIGLLDFIIIVSLFLCLTVFLFFLHYAILFTLILCSPQRSLPKDGFHYHFSALPSLSLRLQSSFPTSN